MRFIELIEKKKQKGMLTQQELHFFIKGFVHQSIPDYQVSAMLMAICLNGMGNQEIAWLCEEMLNSGKIIELSAIQGITCDKHSTGGVGDKTSLALLPMVAACGIPIAKISGRGLGHTGGTLDKLESIQGFQTTMTLDAFIQQVNRIKIGIIGQSDELVPADKQLYALRDVTATVDSIPLIAASIMSKKLAMGADAILLDVKYGDGAFMHTPQAAMELADVMIKIGQHFHKDVRVILTDMNQPLGCAIGNALEVKEAIHTLQGNGPKDFEELCLRAGTIMLLQSGLYHDEIMAKKQLRHVIENGAALQKLIELVEAQGGASDQIRNPELLPLAKRQVLYANCSGYVKHINALTLGQLAMRLGAGRLKKEDSIHHGVGIVLHKKQGDFIKAGDLLAEIYVKDHMDEAWITDFYEAFSFVNHKVVNEPLIYKVMHA